MADQKLILIAESDSFMGELLNDRLQKRGYEVFRVEDKERLFAELGTRVPALVVLSAPKFGKDESMDILQKIRSAHDAAVLPVVVLSHDENEKNTKKWQEAGTTLYLIEAFLKAPDIVAKIEETISGDAPAPAEKEEQKATSSAQGTFAEEGHYEELTKLKARIEKMLVMPTEPSIIELVDLLVAYAFFARASDIHIDPFDDRVAVRLRIDGVLHEMFALPRKIHLPFITRIKVLAGMRTDEHQMAQDGRFKSNIKDTGHIDVRVSIAPTYYGENCVMRILAQQSDTLSLEVLGFPERDMKRIGKAIRKPYGMVLATGPTGSGKTTTLYAILKRLNVPEVSIITIEDPIEYSLRGIDQIQVNERTGLTFAHGLRFILRQDPNIIMVGEIRDNETANIAVNAAMTGHLLLSTLHANDAATALPRLIDMGTEPFLIGSTVNIVIGQRLVRRLCSHCREERELTDTERENLKQFFSEELLEKQKKFYSAPGCKQCNDTGYLGRIGIHEVLEMTDEIRELVMKHANAAEIKAAAVRGGMVTMMRDGFEKAAEGITTLEEVLRVFHE